MAQEIIVTTRAELQAIIAEECNRLYSRLAKRKAQDEQSDTLSLDNAVAFLHEQGYTMAKRTIYDLAHKEAIPYSKFNGKLIFSRKELLNWAECRRMKHIPSLEKQAEILAKNGRKNAIKN